MTFPFDPTMRSPKGDHNRRLGLGIDADTFAVEAGVTVNELHDYEGTSPDGEFDISVAARVGRALEIMEAVKEPRVDNGPKPTEEVRIEGDTIMVTDVDSDSPSTMNPAFP